jgi:hypothetical protein
MSEPDAVPLPREGAVFFDVRGAARSLRLSWYADSRVAVFSIWQADRCTGTFRLPFSDLARMVETLQSGPVSGATNLSADAAPAYTGYQAAYSPTSGYPPASGHPIGNATPGHDDIPAYVPSYGELPRHDEVPSYDSTAAYSRPLGYSDPASAVPDNRHTHPYGDAPGYGGGPGHGDAPGYGGGPDYGDVPGYADRRGLADVPGYALQNGQLRYGDVRSYASDPYPPARASDHRGYEAPDHRQSAPTVASAASHGEWLAAPAAPKGWPDQNGSEPDTDLPNFPSMPAWTGGSEAGR